MSSVRVTYLSALLGFVVTSGVIVFTQNIFNVQNFV